MHIPKVVRGLAVCAAALLCMPAVAQVSSGSVYAQQEHGNWMSLYVTNHAGDNRFRNISASVGGDEFIAIMDIFQHDCSVTLQFSFPYERPLERDTATLDLAVDLRVDSGAVRRAQGTYNGTMGDETGFVVIKASSSFWPLVDDMETGSTLRARFGLPDGTSLTSSFNLAGFAKSFRVTQDACKNSLQSRQDQLPADRPRGSIRERRL